MKKLLSKQGLLTLVLCLSAATYTVSAEEVKKEFHRELVPTNNTTLTITNKFGGVVTETWTENRIVVDVVVKVNHPSAEKAKKILEMINVEFTEADGNLSAETVFAKEFSDFRWSSEDNKFSIDYNVKMPASINLTISNKYGNTDVDEVSGLALLSAKYGNLTVHKLNRGNLKPLNSLVVAYGKASVDFLGWAEVNARYCGQFNIEEATALIIDSRYSKLSLGSVSSLVFDSKYDGYTVDKANNIVASSGYTNLNFGTVTKKLEIDTRYGNLSVESIPAGFEKISVKAGYCSVRLGIDPSACYSLVAESSYGSVKLDDDKLSAQKRIVGNTSTEIEGKMGNCNNPSATVTIDASYGSVKLY